MAKKISTQAVKKATNKSWDEWHQILKQKVREDWNHKDIVSYLINKHKLSHWWAQTVTVDFEQFTGKRQIGQTQSEGYQIGVRKTINKSHKDIWEWLLSKNGSQVWLGKNQIENFKEGDRFQTDGELTVEIRVIKPNHHIRLTWKPKEWESPSLLQIRVYPTSTGKSTIAVHQDNLKNGTVREQMREFWKNVLEKIKISNEV